jgi:O-antigen/teichoic acid export membrane protein
LALFVVAAIVGGVMTLSPDHRPFGWLWVLAVIVVAAYQAAKAAGYATRHARIVTLGELAGALIALTGALMLIWWRPPDLNDALVGAYLLGPLAFLLVFTYRMYGRIRVRAMRAVSSERRLAIRASGLFFVGAGSSMALQYLPVIISGHLAASVTTALLFGALQAGGVLLLLTRAYGTVMMPSFAADHNDSRPSRHMVAVRAIFLPSLALGLGFAPWVVLSLGFTPGPRSVTIAALVILLVLMQVWATPAVTVLSSRGREWIPALASLAGLLLASVFWTVAMRTAESFLLPVGLVAGGAVRSLLPLWIFHGCPVRPSRAGGLAAVGGVAASVAILVWAVPRGATMALAGGTALLTVGLLLTARLVVANGMRDADPAR